MVSVVSSVKRDWMKVKNLFVESWADDAHVDIDNNVDRTVYVDYLGHDKFTVCLSSVFWRLRRGNASK